MAEKFIYRKELLPEPVLEGNKDYIDLYYSAWETAFKKVEYVDKEGWKPMLTCMPGVNITWQWDSCIMTFITNYSNGTLSAFNNLDNLYRLRRESDGFMAMAYRIDTEAEAYPGRINPPLPALAEWEHYIITGDSSRLARVLPALEGLYDFIEKNRRRKSCSLYWFEDSGSSGMDNSPRGAYPAENLMGSDVCHIDLACQQAMSAEYISKINAFLGNGEKAEFYAKEKTRINELINKYHWSEKGGWYFDFFTRSNPEEKVKFINSKTAATFWTLFSGAAKGERAEKVIAHLFNPDEFYTKVPFASLSADDPNYDSSGGYWLGGVWPPTNYAAIKGLCRNGKESLAREAAIKFLNAMAEVWKNKNYGGIWEAYAPEVFAPSTCEDGSLSRSDFVGWGGLAPITMLIENIIGLNFNADENKITFDLAAKTVCGLKNMQFAGGKVSVVCTEYNDGAATVEVEAENDFKLFVKAEYLENPAVFEVKKGRNIFNI